MPQPLEALDEAAFDAILALNVKSIYLAAREVDLPLFDEVEPAEAKLQQRA